MPTQLEVKQQQLTEVQAAISKIVTHGQAYMVQDGGAQRQLTRANLKQLEAREATLQREIARLSGSGGGLNYGMPL